MHAVPCGWCFQPTSDWQRRGLEKVCADCCAAAKRDALPPAPFVPPTEPRTCGELEPKETR